MKRVLPVVLLLIVTSSSTVIYLGRYQGATIPLLPCRTSGGPVNSAMRSLDRPRWLNRIGCFVNAPQSCVSSPSGIERCVPISPDDAR